MLDISYFGKPDGEDFITKSESVERFIQMLTIQSN